MNKSAILIDDEDSCIEILKFELNRINANIDILSVCSDPRKAKKLIEELEPDIVFLDIEMPWINGFELLDSFSKIFFDVIFVTAYDQYAIKAFKYFALDYILKPIDKSALRLVVDQLERNDKRISTKIRDLTQFLKSKSHSSKRISFPTQSGYEVYNINEIIRCEADSNYTKIFLTSNRILMLSKTLKEISSMLDDERFIRVHQSHLINFDFVWKYNKSDGVVIILNDDTCIPVARTKKGELLSRLKRL